MDFCWILPYEIAFLLRTQEKKQEDVYEMNFLMIV